MIDIVKRTIGLIRERKDNIRRGIKNSIPSPLKRFSWNYIGIEKATYYLVTAGTKGGKTQITSFLFLFSPVLQSYYDQSIKVKIFYFPLEETPERVLCRFISFILFSMYNVEVDYKDLMSSRNVELDDKILALIESDDVISILNHFNECVSFVEGESNPTGIYRTMIKYAEENGVVHSKKIKKKDEFGMEVEVDKFVYYQPNNPSEYVLFIVDHISLLHYERGFTKKESMDKLSEYCVELRNKYKFSPVIVQQQVFNETADNFKQKILRPTLTGLSDSKYTSRDANIILGIYSPFRMKESVFLGYDIVTLRDNFRSLEVLANRDGESGGIIGLYFKGNVSHFAELPRPDTDDIRVIYNELKKKNG